MVPGVFFHISIHLSTHLVTYLPIHLCIILSVYLASQPASQPDTHLLTHIYIPIYSFIIPLSPSIHPPPFIYHLPIHYPPICLLSSFCVPSMEREYGLCSQKTHPQCEGQEIHMQTSVLMGNNADLLGAQEECAFALRGEVVFMESFQKES